MYTGANTLTKAQVCKCIPALCEWLSKDKDGNSHPVALFIDEIDSPLIRRLSGSVEKNAFEELTQLFGSILTAWCTDKYVY